MKDKLAEILDDLGIRALFVCMDEEYVENVTGVVLSSLGRASPESRRAFQTELDKLNLPIPGFRNASKAPAHMLTTPVQRALPLSDNLAGAALKVWAESRQGLREIVLERINDVGTYIGVSAEYPDFSENNLKGHWPKDPWERENDRFALLHDDLDEDDIALMMCYVSGKLPGMTYLEEEPDPESDAVMQSSAILELLALCVIDLENLPASAQEWESDIPEFVGKIAEITGAKEEERGSAVNLDAAIADIGNEFSSELAYLESDIGSWSAAGLSAGEDIAGTLTMCEELHSALAEFHAFREAIREKPLASTSREDGERRDKSDELERRIRGFLGGIDGLMSGEPMPDGDPPGQPARAEEQPEGGGAAQSAYPTALRDKEAPVLHHPQAFPEFESERLSRENISLQSERDALGHENDSLRSEVQRLEAENQSLRLDKDDLRGENDSLRAELTESRSDAELWRLAYEDERKIPRLTLEDVPPYIDDVGDAVRYAGDMFPDKLLMKTNSKSQVRDNPFEKPADVWDALKWLATEYYDAKSGVSSVPDFDLSIREACGWQYKSGQYDTTMNKYRDWYTTKTNGKTYRLGEHIAKGTSKDARHTIRIAFDWDKDEKLVVVGFIGQHQQTGAT